MFKGSFFFVLLITLQIHSGWAEDLLQRKTNFEHPVKKSYFNVDYPYNPHVDPEIWDALKPYFLPFNSTTRIILDCIFQSERATISRDTLIAAGFKLVRPQGLGNLSVGKHPHLKGYLIKAFLDIQNVCEWENFLRRITGAQSIDECIKRFEYQDLFRVPQKWIYPLPATPSPPDGDQYQRKNFILIVEDMNLVGSKENSKAFKTKITPEILDKFYNVITAEGLFDSVFRGNIPFNKTGQMCFIDTEHHHGWPISYHFLVRYLNPQMASYWDRITNHRHELQN